MNSDHGRTHIALVRLRSGFTLIEIIVALLVSAVMLTAGRAMIETVADESARTREASERSAAQANADRLLRELVWRIDVGSSIEEGFGGNEREVGFRSWCEVPAGWLESCRCRISIDSTSSGPELTAYLHIDSSDVPVGNRIVLRSGFSVGALRYLESAVGGGNWFHGWGQGITTPLAIGIIVDADTLIVPIGTRG